MLMGRGFSDFGPLQRCVTNADRFYMGVETRFIKDRKEISHAAVYWPGSVLGVVGGDFNELHAVFFLHNRYKIITTKHGALLH